MIVYKLTPEQAEELTGKEYAKDMKFAPTEDVDGNFFIGIEEIQQCENKDLEWIKDLEEIEHKPKIERSTKIAEIK